MYWTSQIISECHKEASFHSFWASESALSRFSPWLSPGWRTHWASLSFQNRTHPFCFRFLLLSWTGNSDNSSLSKFCCTDVFWTSTLFIKSSKAFDDVALEGKSRTTSTGWLAVPIETSPFSIGTNPSVSPQVSAIGNTGNPGSFCLDRGRTKLKHKSGGCVNKTPVSRECWGTSSGGATRADMTFRILRLSGKLDFKVFMWADFSSARTCFAAAVLSNMPLPAKIGTWAMTDQISNKNLYSLHFTRSFNKLL